MPDSLVSMKMSKKETKAQSEPSAVGTEERDRFPFGLSISLEEESLVKLGVSTLPDVGLTDEMVATVRVTSVSDRSHEGSKRDRSVSLQITHMRIGKSKTSDAGKTLYGS